MVANYKSLMIMTRGNQLESSTVTERYNGSNCIQIECRQCQMHIKQISSMSFSFHRIWEQKIHQHDPVNMTMPGSVSSGFVTFLIGFQRIGNSFSFFKQLIVFGCGIDHMQPWTKLSTKNHASWKMFHKGDKSSPRVRLNMSLTGDYYIALHCDHLHQFMDYIPQQ